MVLPATASQAAESGLLGLSLSAVTSMERVCAGLLAMPSFTMKVMLAV